MRTSIKLAAIAAAASTTFLQGTPARAESAELSVQTPSGGGAGAGEHAGSVLLGGKVGGIVPFGGMSPFATGGLELGYVFSGMKGALAVALDADYTAPKQEGTDPSGAVDPRIGAAGGTYGWHLTEQQLALMPVFMYRMTSLGRVVPFAAIGPRFYFLRSRVRGESGGHEIEETTEQSAKIGFGVPLGIEFQLGPGALLAEALLQYGGLDHAATGKSNTGAASLALGYRLFL